MTRTDQINHIGRTIGAALGTPYAFRVEHGSLHIPFDLIDATETVLGGDELTNLLSTVDFDVTDKGLAWTA